MSQFLTVLGIFFYSLAGFATSSGDACFQLMTPSQKWENLKPTQMKCMKSDKEFINSLAQFCTKDGRQFSATYLKYHSFEDQYAAAQNLFKASPDPIIQQEALDEMTLIERDWELFGFRQSIEAADEVLRSARYKCK